MIKEYSYLLRNDAAYAEKARSVVTLTFDLSEFLNARLPALVSGKKLQADSSIRRIVFHPPCTLQHTQKIRGVVESMLTALGAQLMPIAESHLCCGSAGTYSLLQSDISTQLRDRKLENLQRETPAMILSANIGCIAQLQSGTTVPVRHWIEWVDQALRSGE
jgi:glycolate oxidase iron-sulfur subunit